MARLFHSLVVCGAGLTVLHCGGRSVAERQQGDDGTEEPSGSSGSPSGGGGRAGSGATPGGGSAGALSLGGALTMPIGGSAAGMPSEPKRPAGPTEQWGCDASGISCTGQRFNVNYRDCVRDPTRPHTPDDCPPGTSLACLQGYLDEVAVLFNCSCRPPAAEGCACPEVLDNCSARLRPPESCEGTSECGCAITCILR